MDSTSTNNVSFVGVAADVKRNRESDFACGRCSVFGIDAGEHAALAKEGRITPPVFSEEVTKFTFWSNPWLAMRVLGGRGYSFAVTPVGGKILSPGIGERRAMVWTMVRAREESAEHMGHL